MKIELNMITKIDILLQCIFVMLIVIVIFLFRLQYKRALKKIIHAFENQGLKILKYKWVGLWDSGDFKESGFVLGGPLISRGSPFFSFYIYIYYEDELLEKRITAKVDTIFFFIHKISYSSKF